MFYGARWGIHPNDLRELKEGLTTPLSIFYQKSWLSRKVPEVIGEWRLANVTPSYKKCWKEDPGDFRAEVPQ